MALSFRSALINEPFGDPGVYVDIMWARQALLFDLGDNAPLGPARLLRANEIFISHTHMDHFIGFDRLLRVALGRGKMLRLYGPAGLVDNVAGKLRGYTWNLVDGYPLTIAVHEFDQMGAMRSATFRAADGFAPRDAGSRPVQASGPNGVFTVLEEAMFTVSAVALNHRIPSFAYALQERCHINVYRDRLHAAGLPVGSWLKSLKHHLWQGQPDEFRFTATLYFEHRKEEREFRLGDLREFVSLSRGQKLAYVVDVRYDPQNETKVVDLAREADIVYCEAPYLDRDAGKAWDRYHLTARQAGTMARKAEARRLVVFHFSPRYTGQADAIVREAMDAFQGPAPDQQTWIDPRGKEIVDG